MRNQEERNRVFEEMVSATKKYLAGLEEDFNEATSVDDEEFLDGEMGRVEEFLAASGVELDETSF
jgi:hypothetical protein